MRLALAAIALALWSCPAHAFCEPTEEEIAAARDRIEAREASGIFGMGDDVAMVMDADNIRKRLGPRVAKMARLHRDLPGIARQVG